MEKLPTEIAANIFSRLPFDSVLQCKCVSKYWCNLLQLLIYTSGERYFAQKHRSNLIENHRHLNSSSSSSPDSVLLMLDQSVDNNQTCRQEDGDQLHYVEYNEDKKGEFNCKAMKEFNSPLKMDSKFWTMASSSNGLICSAHHQTDDDSYLLYVCNPFLGEYVTLPKFIYSAKSSMAFGFGHVFSTDEYKVVRIVYPPGDGDVGNVEVYTLGGEKNSSSNGKWRSKGNIKCRLQCDSPAVLVNESLHWLAEKDEKKKKKQNIVVFDLLEEEFREIPLPHGLQTNSNFKMKEQEGSLCGIDYRKETRRMLMWKFMEDCYMKYKKQGKEKEEYWKNILGTDWRGPLGYEHCFYWKRVDQSLLWMSNSSVVVVEHDVNLGPKIDKNEMNHARLFHGIPHSKSFVSLTALGENDAKTIKDNNRKRKQDNKPKDESKNEENYILFILVMMNEDFLYNPYDLIGRAAS